MAQRNKQWTVYLLLLANGHYYTGITTDVDKRMTAHHNGKGSKYVRAHSPFKLVFQGFAGNNRSWAQKMEAKVKKLSHNDKKELAVFYEYLKGIADGKYENSV